MSDTTVADTQTYDDVTVRADNGTDGGSGGNGLPGSSVTLTVKSGGLLTATTLEIYGGNGGYGTDNNGNGGKGGDGTLTVESGGTLTAETINLYGGASGSGSAGGGAGAATLKADTLKLGNGGLTLIGGATATIGTLTLTGTGKLDDTSNTGGTLSIDSLAFDGGTLNNTNWDGLVGAGRTYTSTNDITLGTNNGLTVDIASSKILERKLIGTGGLTVKAAGQLTLTQANDYSGKTQVNAGTLRLDNAAATGTGDVTLANGTMLFLRFNGTYTNKISGAGSVAIGALSGNTVILKNAENDYSGYTLVNSYTTLELAHVNAAGTGRVDVASGATLRLSASGTYTNSALRGASGSTLEVMKNDAQVSSISGFENYVFAADALDKNTAALKLKNQGSALTVEANNVSFDVGNAGLVALNDSVTLIESTKDITLTGNAEQTGWLDGAASTLKATVYKLEKAAAGAGAKLEALVSELYLYGKGGTGAGTGQRPSGNTLTFDSGEATAAFGGRASNDDVSNNTLTIDGTAKLVEDASKPLSGKAFGGYADNGNASNNTIQLQSGATAKYKLYGGYSNGAVAFNNTVTAAADGAITTADEIRGGDGYSGATDNTVTLTANNGGRLAVGKITGGYAYTGDASGNTVTLSGDGEFGVTDAVYGGYAESGSASGNTVTLAATQLNQVKLYGGNTATITGNTLKVQANGITADSIQNFEQYEFAASALKENTVALKLANQGALNINAANVAFNTSGGGLGLGWNQTATLIDAGSATLNVTGAGAHTATLDGAGILPEKVYNLAQDGNKLNVTFNELYLYGDGGTNNPGQRETGNSLTLNGGTATAAFAGRALNGNVTGNTLTINAPTTLQQGAAYGGYADNGSATDNTVILSSKMSGQTASFDIYGGNTGASGNTLAVQGKGINVAGIHNFDSLYFILPDGTAQGDTMLTVNGGAATQFTAAMTNVGVGIAGGGSALQAGDQVTLLTNPVGLHNASGGELVQGTDYQLVTTGTQGFSLSHDFELSNDANSLNATVKTPPSPPPQPQPTPPQPKPQPTPEPEPVPPKPEPVPPKPQPVPPAPQVDPRTKAVPESRVAVMGMLNLGADQIVRMTGNLPSSTGGGAPNFGGSGVSPNTQTPDDATAFADISVHRQKIETGSHVNVNGASAIVGAAKAIPLAGGGTAAVGAFFEYGDGSFKTHNDFDTGDVNGKGDSNYYGAGVLARVNLAPRGSADGGGAPFVEGSLHAGSIHSNWHTDDLRDAATGQRAQYDIRTPYMGAHVGAGYRWQTGAASHVEAYGQYLYTHMDGKDTNVALDPYHFNAVKSSRTRLGAKGTWAVSQQTQAYAGAAWEREFDGTARATAYSFDVPAPTMKGNSAVIDAGLSDAGLSFQPKRNLSTNVGVTGYAGKRKGAAANVEVQYLF